MNASLKHELSTPLTHIIGYCEMLMEEAQDQARQAWLPDLERIHAAGTRLLSVVNELFDPSKAEALRKDQRQLFHQLRTPLNQIIGYSEMLQEEAREQKLESSLADLDRIHSAAHRLLQLVIEHFVPTLLVRTPSAPARQSAPAVRAMARGPTGSLLVVDDDDVTRLMLGRRLVRLGHEVVMAENGRAALAKLRAAPFDLVLLDIEMPQMNGYEVLEQMKADPAWRALPVLVLSGSGETDRVARCIELGAEDYLPKPFDPILLQARIGACLEKKHLHDREVSYRREIETKNAELQAEMRRREQAEQSLLLIEQEHAGRFHTSGTLRPDAPSYVERKADQELFHGVLGGEFCYVLTSRQMGKSSLMVRTTNKLRARGGWVATVDLTAIGTNVTPDQWYLGLLSRVGWQLNLEDALEESWNARTQVGPCQRFFTVLRETALALAPKNLILFVDELDLVRSLPFRTDEFFAAIRECYNRRSEDPALNRLTFCLLGVATPSELIQDPRMTPFNIGRRIELEDFTREEVAPLARGLNRPMEAAGELMDRIHYWTGGHPYLTQKLCKAVVVDERVQTAAAVDDLCSALFFDAKSIEIDDNLTFVRERLLHSDAPLPEVLQTYGRVRSGGPVAVEAAPAVLTVLQMAGVVCMAEGRLRVRNRIYEQVFNQAWLKRVSPQIDS